MKKNILLVSLLSISLLSRAQTGTWDDQFKACGLLNGNVLTLAIDSNKYIYAGGNIRLSGQGDTLHHIVRWNGTKWEDVGGGTNDYVFDIKIAGGILYATGSFTQAGGVACNRIAKWDGTNWSPLGAGLSSIGYCLAISGSDIYAGGYFEQAGGITVNHIARWNGTSWSALGTGVNREVSAIAVSGSNVYAGGYFDEAGGNPALHVAKWNGSTWSALGDGLMSSSFAGHVEALAARNDSVWAGGDFHLSGATTVRNFALWNGSVWQEAGGGLDDEVTDILIKDKNIYVCGHFYNAYPSTPVNRKGIWNGTTWTSIGEDLNSNAYAMGLIGDTLILGGSFTQAGSSNKPLNMIAKCIGSYSLQVGKHQSFDQSPCAFIYIDTVLYVGGLFTSFRDISCNNIIKYDGHTWSAMGTGTNGLVKTMAKIGNDLYIGGSFTNVNGITAQFVAKWNGSVWSQVGNGFNATVNALLNKNDTLFACGDFTMSGPTSVNRIAFFNGTEWLPLGLGLGPNTAMSMAAIGNNLFVGGDFTIAGGTSAKKIARWSGSKWWALGTGITGTVKAMASLDTVLLVGGDITYAGSSVPNTDIIAKWDGYTWSAAGNFEQLSGQGFIGESCLYSTGAEIYAAGRFTINGISGTNYLAKFDGNGWYSVGNGVNSTIQGVYARGKEVWLGGLFSVAGDKTVSYYCAHYFYPPDIAVTIETQPVNTQVCRNSSQSLSVTCKGTTPILYQWYKNNTPIPGATGAALNFASAQFSDSGYYFCKVSNVLDTLYTDTVKLTVHPLPVVNLGSDHEACGFSTDTIDAGSGFSAYQWAGGGSPLNQYNYITASGTYSVTVTDANGCKQTDAITVTFVYPYAKQQICVVTNDLDTWKNMIVWERKGARNIKQYNVYRETAMMGVYALIGSVPFDSVSSFVDLTSQPQNQQHLYKITSVDSCDNESSIDSCLYHKTMLLQYAGSTGGINLSWSNRYEINGVPYNFVSYIIYRGSDSSALAPLDTVSGSLFAYIDTDPLAQMGRMFYRIGGLSPTICAPSIIKANSGPFSQSISNLEDNRLQITNIKSPSALTNLYIYPNPFKKQTTVHLSLKSRSNVCITLNSITGVPLATIIDKPLKAGIHSIGIFAEDHNMHPGLYLIITRIDGHKFINRIVAQ